RWGLAAMSGAISWWHVDSNGFGSYIDVKAGVKWWIVAQRWDGHESFSEVMKFFDSSYEVEEPNDEDWDLEAVMLHPRTRLIMRLNTPHAVFMAENVICHGGHFFS
ncbi:hypothetical protein BYT27DRAFT_7016126, partial [Phlegmacium glaucopus]